MIPIRPFNFLLKFVVKKLIQKSLVVTANGHYNAKLIPLIIPVVSAIFQLPRLLFKAIGILPTFKVLNTIRQCLVNPIKIITIKSVLEAILNSTNKLTKPQIKLLLETLNPVLDEMIKLPETYAKVFKYFQYFLMFSSIGPFFRVAYLYTLRTSLGLLFSSIGIVWNESLSAITTLRDISFWVLSTFESFSGISIPRGVPTEIIPDSKPETVEDLYNHSEFNKAAGFFEIVGMICMGVIVTGTTLIIFDHYHPDTFQNIPYINGFLDMVHNLWSPLHPTVPDAVQPPNPPAPPVVPNNTPVEPPVDVPQLVDFPEVISRSSSGATVTAENFAAGQITPPATPEPVIPNNFE